MENKILIDLSVKYGLDTKQLSKIVDMVYQAGVRDMNSKEFSRIAGYICEMNLIDLPAEKVIEELRQNGFVR